MLCLPARLSWHSAINSKRFKTECIDKYVDDPHSIVLIQPLWSATRLLLAFIRLPRSRRH
jgi:hypothetical protein